jgi:NADH-quinone oxidoreductase subunit L
LPNYLEHFLNPVFFHSKLIIAQYTAEHHYSETFEILFVVISIIVALAAVIFSFKKFAKQDKFEENTGFAKVLEDRYYIDEVYDKSVVQPIFRTSESFLYKIFDIKIIDGFVNFTGDYLVKLSGSWRKLQTGIIQDYTTVTIAGIVIIIIFLLLSK